MRHYTVVASAPTLFRKLCSRKRTTFTPLFTPRRSTGFTFQCFSNSPTVPDTPSTSHNDQASDVNLLKQIVSDLEASGNKFILPTTDCDAMQRLARALKSLSSVGVKPVFLIDACVKNPQMFRNLTTKGEEAWQIINLLVESCSMTYEDALRMFAGYGDELLACSSEGVQSRADVLVNCGVPTGRGVGRIVRKCPAILFARNSVEMSKVAEALGGFFSRKDMAAIVQVVPEVLLKDIEELEEKYEYIFFHMCIEGDEFRECKNWPLMDLDDIMTRHEFLLKTGKYMTPDPKHPQKKMENPRLHHILDSSDDNFAVQVAGVSKEEWAIYRAYAEQLLSSSGKDRPYERVKPSMRKAYERRKKEAKSIYSTISHNHMPLQEGVASQGATMTMGNPVTGVISPIERAMSIDEHLQSMPMPSDWNEQYRSQEEVDMLSMGSANRSVLHAPGLPCQLRNVIVSRCDGNIPSSSDASSSSCSPSSTENIHQQQPLKSSETTIDSAVASVLNQALKPEPSDGEFSADSNASSAHRMPMQPMPLPIGAGYGGRCSDNSGTSGAMSNTSGSSTPTPSRRSRSSHDGMLKCQFCPKKWADQNALHSHMADCRLARGHECAQCGKRFKARGGLQQHLRIHSNDRPYACHFCAKRFTQKSHVDQHERIHTGSKPFSCQYCGRAFRQRSQQLGHEATHSNLLNSATHVVTQQSNQHLQHPTSSTQQQDLLRNELQSSNGLLHDLQTSTLPTSDQLSLLALGQTTSSTSPQCTNNAVSSLLALSQNQPNPAPTHPPFPTPNHLHQAAVGLLNSLQ